MKTAGKGQICVRYAVFKTKWGYFSLAGTDDSLWRTHLPAREAHRVEQRLLKNLSVKGQAVRLDESFLKSLQGQVIAYFEGNAIDFSVTLPLNLDSFGLFTRSVLNACRSIKYGQVISYSQLARQLGRPNAVRAVGNALAANPLPLIIPCHRIIRTDGSLGGFSAPGGTRFKERLLIHEGYTKKSHLRESNIE